MDATDNQPQYCKKSPDEHHPQDAPRKQQQQHQQEEQRQQQSTRNSPLTITRSASIRRYPVSISSAHQQQQRDYSVRATAVVETRYVPFTEKPLILPLFV